jgi:hypothetical protein
VDGYPQDNPLFSTFDEWEVHVQSKDYKQFRGWTCLLCKISPRPNDEHTLLQHVQKEHPKAVTKESLANFVNMCRRSKALALEWCLVCSTKDVDWKMQKDIDVTFEPHIRSFLEHVGQCMHNFALRVLPDPEPIWHRDESDQNLSTVSSINDRSWPSDYLHVSHHPDARLTDADLEKLQDHTRPDKVIDFQRLQAWCESVQNLEDPNSLDETEIMIPAGKRQSPFRPTLR